MLKDARNPPQCGQPFGRSLTKADGLGNISQNVAVIGGVWFENYSDKGGNAQATACSTQGRMMCDA